MTESVGRGARWGTAAVVAPLAAGALAAATSWGLAHPPAASGKNSLTSQQSGASLRAGGPVTMERETLALDKSLLSLQQRATTERARVIHLQKILNRLHTRTRALARSPLPGGGASSTVHSVYLGSPAAAPPPRDEAQAPAPAPAPHVTTGAS